MFSVNCGWTTMIRRQLQDDTELINKIAYGKTSKPPRTASTAPSTFKLDTGALYFETMQSGGDQQNTYLRLSRLVEFYYFETTASSGSASIWQAQAP